MPTERQRILELALESLENRKKQIEEEIASLNSQLRGRRPSREQPAAGKARPSTPRRRQRFSNEERRKRSERMKAYWDKWRKEKARQK